MVKCQFLNPIVVGFCCPLKQERNMAADKKVLLAMFMKMQEDVLKFIPENERPDVTDLVKFGGQQFLNPKVTECKGYRIPSPFSAETAKWQYDNWNPSDQDVLVASFPKTGKIFWEAKYRLIEKCLPVIVLLYLLKSTSKLESNNCHQWLNFYSTKKVLSLI